MSLFGPPNIKKMRESNDYKGLVKALKHNRPDIRADAAEALGTCAQTLTIVSRAWTADPNSAAGQLFSRLSPGYGNPLAIANVEIEMAGLRELALDPLVAALKDSSDDVRGRAAAALGELGDARAVGQLHAALRDNSGDVRTQAEKALERLQGQRGEQAAPQECQEQQCEAEAPKECQVQSSESELNAPQKSEEQRTVPNRFCGMRNEPVRIEIDREHGSQTCVAHALDAKCREANCQYTMGGNMLTFLMSAKLGSNAKTGLRDYTTALVEAPQTITSDSGQGKPCDICGKTIGSEGSHVLNTDEVLASNEYVDFVIRGWVQQGFIPASTIANGIGDHLREPARNDIRQQGGSTPWRVCKVCLPMFKLTESEKAEVRRQSEPQSAAERGKPETTAALDPLRGELEEFYALKEPEDLQMFVNSHPPQIIGPLVRQIDLKGMATIHNPWSTGSIHRTKVLELARILTRQGRRDDAEICLNKLSEMADWPNDELTPSDFLLLIDLGKDLMSFARELNTSSEHFKAKMRECIHVFDRACSVARPGASGFVEALQWKAACHVNLGERETGKELFRQVLKYEPDNKMATELLPKL